MSVSETKTNGVTPFAARDSDWQQIQDALRGLRYGSVNIIVQDGVIVQVDRTEKRRLRHSATSNASASNSTANGQQRAC
ncbi:MAG: YezD family protein [Bythopirellula sp.]|nr:YezD family protein [Bythopirellula sp.]